MSARDLRAAATQRVTGTATAARCSGGEQTLGVREGVEPVPLGLPGLRSRPADLLQRALDGTALPGERVTGRPRRLRRGRDPAGRARADDEPATRPGVPGRAAHPPARAGHARGRRNCPSARRECGTVERSAREPAASASAGRRGILRGWRRTVAASDRGRRRAAARRGCRVRRRRARRPALPGQGADPERPGAPGPRRPGPEQGPARPGPRTHQRRDDPGLPRCPRPEQRQHGPASGQRRLRSGRAAGPGAVHRRARPGRPGGPVAVHRHPVAAAEPAAGPGARGLRAARPPAAGPDRPGCRDAPAGRHPVRCAVRRRCRWSTCPGRTASRPPPPAASGRRDVRLAGTVRV